MDCHIELPEEVSEELLSKLNKIDLSKISVDTIDLLPQELTTLTIKIKGEQFDGTITGEVTRALWDLQASYYRAAALVLHGSENIATLSDEEKRSLELVFSVNKGCSLFSFNLSELFSSILPEVIKTMPPEYSATLIIAFLLSSVAGYNFNKWLKLREKEELMKHDNDKTLEHEKTIREAFKTMENIAERTAKPFVAVKATHAPQIAKAAHSATEVDFANYHFDRNDIIELNKRSPRTKTKSEVKTMSLRIRGLEIDEKFSRIKIKATDEDTQENIDAFIAPSGMFSDQNEMYVPRQASDVAKVIDNKQTISAEVLIKESKTKVERFIISWFDPSEFPNLEEES